jgi:hypothetical protein
VKFGEQVHVYFNFKSAKRNLEGAVKCRSWPSGLAAPAEIAPPLEAFSQNEGLGSSIERLRRAVSFP